MALNEDINQDMDALTTAIGGIVTGYKTEAQIIVDLKKQIADGPPGLTAAQAEAFHQRFVANQKTIADALAPVVEVPPPQQIP
jgi:hypothetical protein